ncbi:MAG TPA: VCBS repeat-containing protein [Acidimicrobiales bacterium]|nr:VCBS repeat-containing protein [Acidimicrobiales bacterium]
MGTQDFDGDGRPEIVVDPRDGATAHHVVLARAFGCRVEPMRSPDGGALRLLAWQSSTGMPDAVVGTTCVDLDGDGRREVVEFTRSEQRRAYVAYRLPEGGSKLVAEVHSEAGGTWPAALTPEPGVRCGAFTY